MFSAFKRIKVIVQNNLMHSRSSQSWKNILLGSFVEIDGLFILSWHHHWMHNMEYNKSTGWGCRLRIWIVFSSTAYSIKFCPLVLFTCCPHRKLLRFLSSSRFYLWK